MNAWLELLINAALIVLVIPFASMLIDGMFGFVGLLQKWRAW